MSEPLKISDIAKILHDYFLTPEERELNNTRQLTIEINKTLVETGDLTESALGKIETKQGAEHGICGVLRETEDKRYWVPLYPEEARKYVEQVVLDHYDSIVKQPVQETNQPADPAAEKRAKKQEMRNAWTQLKETHGDRHQIFILEDPTGYWTFDEEAVLMASICGVTLNQGTDTHALIHNSASHALVLRALNNAGITYMVAASNAMETTQETPGNRIQENMKFTLQDSDGNTMKFIIQELEGDVNSVEHVDGTEHIFLRPVTTFEECRSLSQDTPLARAALGHQEGDTFLCNDIRYTVVDIDADDIS